jgi:hypothetical protein
MHRRGEDLLRVEDNFGADSFEFRLPGHKVYAVTVAATSWCRISDARQPGRPAELVDKGVKRAVLIIGRAEIAQTNMRLGVEPLRHYRGDSRLANAGFAGDQHDLAVTGLGARPAPQQQLDLLVAPNQRGQR